MHDAVVAQPSVVPHPPCPPGVEGGDDGAKQEKAEHMGLDSYVSCQCWEQGLCRAPPVEFARFLKFDEKTKTVGIVIPDTFSATQDMELYAEFSVWREKHACVHHNMCAANERIASWGGIRLFQAALRNHGTERYATLLREIPDGNGGTTQPEAALACLAELDDFTASVATQRRVELVDVNSGQVLCTRVPAYEGRFAGNASTSFRLSEDGALEIEQHVQPGGRTKARFRSNAFTQNSTVAGVFQFADTATGEQIICEIGIMVPDEPGHFPTVLAVRQVRDSPDRYAYCMEPLRSMFKTCVDTGNPVVWT